MAAATISEVTCFFRAIAEASAMTQSIPMTTRNGNAISFVDPARTKSKAINHEGARMRHAEVKARIRNAAAISPKVECEYHSSGLVIMTRTPAIASAQDAFFFSVQNTSRTEPTNEKKL